MPQPVEAGAQPSDLGIGMVQVQPRAGARVEPGRADVDHAAGVVEPHVDPVLGLRELAVANAQEDELAVGGRHGYSSGIMLASAIASAAGLAILSRFGRFMPSASQRSISTKSSSMSVSEDTFFSTRPCA